MNNKKKKYVLKPFWTAVLFYIELIIFMIVYLKSING